MLSIFQILYSYFFFLSTAISLLSLFASSSKQLLRVGDHPELQIVVVQFSVLLAAWENHSTALTGSGIELSGFVLCGKVIWLWSCLRYHCRVLDVLCVLGHVLFGECEEL